MVNLLLITLGKILSKTVQVFNLGNGSTWPGHIALKINKHFLREVLSKSNLKIILIAGTNGKTTTTALIRKALEDSGKTVIQNESGANLLNGIASTLICSANLTNVILSKAKNLINHDFALFEIDENALPLILKELTPAYIVLLNLFRDQLDRYGEVNTIAEKWKKSLANLSPRTTLILNADDPLVASLTVIPSNEGIQKSAKQEVLYFGLAASQFSTDQAQHAADTVHCPKCGEKLTFKAIAFSHLGDWQCMKCGLTRPKVATYTFAIYPLPGIYNKYNVLAAIKLLEQIGLTNEQIEDAFTTFEPAFGRQEIIDYKGKKVQLFLSKNPTSFNQSYETIKNLNATTLLLILNDRVPDGHDVSWIWDVELPEIHTFKHILVAGDRVYDMALRVKYEDCKSFQTFENLEEAINKGIALVEKNETLFILPTYSAMLECRKILTGKKIL